jgi:phage shock protein PspC (stress-responsive transcriptional regulator)
MTSAQSTSTRPELRRDGERRLLFGVCAGIARMLGTDPVVVRAVAILAGLLTGPLAVIAYVAAAVIAPRDDGRMLLAAQPRDRRELLLGWLSVALAAALLLSTASGDDLLWIDEPFGGTVLAIALVALVWAMVRANRDRDRPSAPAPSGPAAPAPADAGADQPTKPTTAMAVRVPPTRAPGPAAPPPPSGSTPPTVEMRPPAPPPPPPRGPSIFPIAAGVLLGLGAVGIVLGASGLVDWSAEAVAIALGVAALACGVTAAVAGGRRGTGATLAVGILLALGAGGVAAIADELDDGVGHEVHRPRSAAAIAPEYRLGMGLLEIDLRGVELPDGVTPLVARLGFGEIQIRVDPEVRIDSVGESGVSGDLEPTRRPPTGEGEAPVLAIDAEVDVGDVDVIRDA